jgi:hypothetical protein
MGRTGSGVTRHETAREDTTRGSGWRLTLAERRSGLLSSLLSPGQVAAAASPGRHQRARAGRTDPVRNEPAFQDSGRGSSARACRPSTRRRRDHPAAAGATRGAGGKAAQTGFLTWSWQDAGSELRSLAESAFVDRSRLCLPKPAAARMARVASGGQFSQWMTGPPSGSALPPVAELMASKNR